MKTFALVITLIALVSVANAEQGDAADRALTERMMHETQATQPLSTTAHGDDGKTNVQSGYSESKVKKGDNTSNDQ
ncbi:hypothetical protein [Burkholderia ubonensis]|uniref:hypothetical protein n=1 Tax=Burkholderia ubonensis TaxID=101571 RepID=UPI000B112973|nr:hypothetical protein [Burkholderia ubonensis]